jgi:putative endonuclease
MKTYYVYIMTNKNKTVLYIGVTNDLQRRLFEHSRGLIEGFTKRYNCHYLLHYEEFNEINQAIEREKELKKWRREKKESLINQGNPEWFFKNDEVLKG